MDDGFFQWKRRMGVHEAYHRNAVNRLLHWAFIPLELWAVVKLFSLVPLGPFDLSLAVIAAIAPLYLLTDVLMGAAMVAFLLGCRQVALGVLPTSPLWGAAVAVLVFAVTFGAQVGVGHRVFEEGRDDTDQNLAEVARTRNPLPVLLVFYYHLVELFLAVGYRPALKAQIDRHMQAALAAFGKSPPKSL